MKNTTLLMVGIIGAVSMLSAAGLSIIAVQQASANLIGEDGDGGDTSFSFDQDQSNKCSGHAYCSNYGEINFGF
ncbi:MAG TPA: hypothetical protein VE818_06765 [Nitrososphaeraceae archaeon]|nr:hypothetical protein [Nitrososphaeraceae archaeon]